MITKTALALIFTVFLTVGLDSSACEAQSPSCCLNSWGIQSGNRVIAPNPPYFAMHPPVYYDRIVPRAYGISPFAVPPGVMPVENEVRKIVAPKSVKNPYFQPADRKARQASDPVETGGNQPRFQKAGSKKVINPHYPKKVV